MSYIIGLYKAISKISNHDLIFVSNNSDYTYSVLGVKNASYITYSSKNKFYRLLFEIPRIIKNEKIDFAHFQYITPIIKNCKWIVSIHDVIPLDFRSFFNFSMYLKVHSLFRLSAKRSDIICSISEYSLGRIVKHFKITNNKIIITPIAVNKSVIAKSKVFEKPGVLDKNLLDSYRYIIYVSRIEPRKNQHIALKAFFDSGLYDKGYKFVFVGFRAADYSVFWDQLNALSEKCRDTIIFLEGVPDEELAILYYYAKFSVYISVAEGFGIPPIESIANNCPVIASNNTALAELKSFITIYVDCANLSEVILAYRGLESMSGRVDDCISRKLNDKFTWGQSAKILLNQMNI
jgi:glycosyltransferase involved in cell wall biosynthesis